MRPPGRTAEDASIEAFKTENRERLFAFSIPQPPGDPKLLEVPVDLSNAKMDFAPEVAKKIGHLGLELDDSLNRKHGIEDRGIISGPTGPSILVVPTDEECLIARDTAARLAG